MIRTGVCSPAKFAGAKRVAEKHRLGDIERSSSVAKACVPGSFALCGVRNPRLPPFGFRSGSSPDTGSAGSFIHRGGQVRGAQGRLNGCDGHVWQRGRRHYKPNSTASQIRLPGAPVKETGAALPAFFLLPAIPTSCCARRYASMRRCCCTCTSSGVSLLRRCA